MVAFKELGVEEVDCFWKFLNVKAFCIFAQVIAAVTDGITNGFRQIAAEAFVSPADDFYEVYTRKCRMRHEGAMSQ